MPEFFCYCEDDYIGAEKHGERQAKPIIADDAESAAKSFGKEQLQIEQSYEDGDYVTIAVKDGEKWRSFEVMISVEVEYDVEEVEYCDPAARPPV